jgi:uridine kinase
MIEAYADLAARVLAAPARLGPVRLVAVDGPSGAGKTHFAERLASSLAALAGVVVPVVHTDDLLDGWDDQLIFWPRLDAWVLSPLRRGRPGRYRVYDWHAGRFGDTWHTVPPAPVVILEGVSSARAAIRPELSLAVFVTAPPAVCLRRVLARDGEAVRPYLDRWRLVEQRHFAADATPHHADLVVDGAPRPADDPVPPYDPRRQFVRLDR